MCTLKKFHKFSFKNQWTIFFLFFSSEKYYYIVLRIILGVPYSLDSFQTLLNVPTIYQKHYCKNLSKKFNNLCNHLQQWKLRSAHILEWLLIPSLDLSWLFLDFVFEYFIGHFLFVVVQTCGLLCILWFFWVHGWIGCYPH
jgi:hypothetical protein